MQIEYLQDDSVFQRIQLLSQQPASFSATRVFVWGLNDKGIPTITATQFFFKNIVLYTFIFF